MSKSSYCYRKKQFLFEELAEYHMLESEKMYKVRMGIYKCRNCPYYHLCTVRDENKRPICI